MQNIIRLPLDNAYNVRELGGYYTKDKQITQWHRFLRSDDISQLTDQDDEFCTTLSTTFIFVHLLITLYHMTVFYSILF